MRNYLIDRRGTNLILVVYTYTYSFIVLSFGDPSHKKIYLSAILVGIIGSYILIYEFWHLLNVKIKDRETFTMLVITRFFKKAGFSNEEIIQNFELYFHGYSKKKLKKLLRVKQQINMKHLS